MGVGRQPPAVSSVRLESRPASTFMNECDSVSRQRDTNDFLIVAGIDGFVREGGVRPDDGPARIAVDGIEQVRAADFLIFFRAEFRDDKVALFAEDKTA